MPILTTSEFTLALDNMHPIRRRKKRPNYGVRTVEVTRGKKEFGFTISGQQPCILSCIVAGSPAEKAGLRPGDYLVAVNGQNVSKVPHDDVVRLIGNSTGVLKLQIAENYYSDSSDDDVLNTTRPKPKYPHKPRHRFVQSRAAKVIEDLQTGAMFDEQPSRGFSEPSRKPRWECVSLPNDYGVLFPLPDNIKLGNLHYPAVSSYAPKSPHVIRDIPPPPGRPALQAKKERSGNVHSQEAKCKTHRNIIRHGKQVVVPLIKRQHVDQFLYLSLEKPESSVSIPAESQPEVQYKAVVGYLGTIEMPKELQPGSRLQVIRNCIRRMRIEKKIHTMVLMSVYALKVVLTNSHGMMLAEYPAEKITFCGTCADDKRFFGLVTSQGVLSDDVSECGKEDSIPLSSSCHVFMVEPKMQPHREHAGKAETFRLKCTVNPESNKCEEFPDSADPILQAVTSVYKERLGDGDFGRSPGLIDADVYMNASPQHSNASSNSSNSDSGIGFKDDGHHSDRVIVVDVENERMHIQRLSECMCRDDEVQVSSQLNSLNEITCACYNSSRDNRLTVRAMPDPVGVCRSKSPSNVDDFNVDRQKVSKANSGQRFILLKPEELQNWTSSPYQRSECVKLRAKDLRDGAMSDNSQDNFQELLSYKLSPKVFGVKMPTRRTASDHPVAHSLEDIKVNRSTETKHDFADSSHLETKKYSSLDWVSQQPPCHPGSVPSFLFSSEANLSRSVQSSSLLPGRAQWGSLQDLRTSGLRSGEQPHSHGPLQQESKENMQEDEQLNNQAPKKWGGGGYFGHAFGNKRLTSNFINYLAVSDDDVYKHSGTEGGDGGTVGSEQTPSERGIDVGRVGSWAASFEKLLDDPAGLHTFAEFLKKEFSHENIYFWVACEKYRKLTDVERKNAAQDIFKRHLDAGAMEPVNVDSYARQITNEGLREASPHLFVQAQKQIFNLMKFDSYPRFLKSELYKECLLKDMSGQDLPFPGGEDLDSDLHIHDKDEPNPGKLKKSCSDAEERRRKSLLPWNRKNRSKSKDRGESEYNKMKMQNKDDSSSVRSDITSSRSSLASSDLAMIQRGTLSRQSLTSGEHSERESCQLCRVILPDGATTVVQTRKEELIRDLVNRLLDKRGLKYSAFEVFDGNSVKPIPLTEESIVLAGKEVRVEQRVIFRLDLPSRKSVGVKAKHSKTVGEVLRSILHKYGYRMDFNNICLVSDNQIIDPSAEIASVDGLRLQVKGKPTEGYNAEQNQSSLPQKMKVSATLDEITNKVFEELLKGKTDSQSEAASTSDQCSVRSEDISSEHSSGIFGRFLRRDSTSLDKTRESKSKSKKSASSKFSVSRSELEAKQSSLSGNKFLAAKLNSGVRPLGRSESEELYEGLKRAQRSRLEDQRGTEINFELPEFLKDKENDPQSSKKIRKVRRSEGNLYYEEQIESDSTDGSTKYVLGGDVSFISKFLENSFSRDGIIPTPQQAEDYFLSRNCSISNLRSNGTCLSVESSRKEFKLRQDMAKFLQHSAGLSNVLSGKAQNVKVKSSEMSSLTTDGLLNNAVSDDVKAASAELDLDKTLINNDGDETLTPSKFLSSNTRRTSLSHLEEANLTPPSPVAFSEQLDSDRVSMEDFPHRSSDPPPLPPKPRNIATRTAQQRALWITSSSSFTHLSGDDKLEANIRGKGDDNNSLQPVEKRDLKICRNRRAIYLDQPSSSFV